MHHEDIHELVSLKFLNLTWNGRTKNWEEKDIKAYFISFIILSGMYDCNFEAII